MESVRKVIFFKSHFTDFYDEQSEKVKSKIDEVLFLISVIERIPSKFLKHLEGTEGLYEIRIEAGNNIFRIFCCFDEGKLVVLFNGFQKKTQKTPKSEIEKAEKLKQEYFNGKAKNKKDGQKK